MEITLATKFTIARIILIIPTVACFIVGMLFKNLNATVYLALTVISCVLFAILCSTDFIDGNIARKTNTVSDLGKFLDPLADKVIIVVMLFMIVYFKDFSIFTQDVLVIAILSGIVLSRELTISVFRSIAAKKGIVLAADIYGKLKTVFLDFGVGFLIVGGLHISLAWIGTLLFYIGSILAIFSGFNYMIKNKQVFK